MLGKVLIDQVGRIRYSTRSVVAPHVSPSSRFLLVSFNPLNNRHDVNVNYNPKDKTRNEIIFYSIYNVYSYKINAIFT